MSWGGGGYIMIWPDRADQYNLAFLAQSGE